MSQPDGSRKVQNKTTRSPLSRGRVTLGLLVDWAVGDYQEAFILGVLDAARRRNAHLLCFAGESLASPGDPNPRNAAFGLASADNVDALIVATSSLGNIVGPEGVAQFCKRFGDLPMVSVSAELPGVPSVLVDNDSGMRELVTHLVRDHGYRRIAFIRGAIGNVEAEGRYHAYRDVLQTNGLEIHENLIVEPNPAKPLAANAIEQLLDERHVRIDTLDAIIVCDDSAASSVLRELESRGIRAPEQIAITGFDDSDEARYENPPLTTVRQPVVELGARAVQIAMDLLNGIPVAARTVLSTQLVVRASCGCFARGKKALIVQPGATRQRQDFEAALIERRDLILAAIARSARAGLGAAGAGWEGRLLNALIGSLRTDSADEFLRAVDEVLRALLAEGGEVRVLYDVLLALRGQALAALNPASEQRGHAELLFHEAGSIVSEALERVQANRRIMLKIRTRGVAGVVTGFYRWRAGEDLSVPIVDALMIVGVGACYLAVYDPPLDRSRARLTFAYEGHRRLPAAEATAASPSQKVVSDVLTRDDRPAGFVVAPLFFDGEDLGFMLIELGKCDASVFYVLPALVSVALYQAKKE